MECEDVIAIRHCLHVLQNGGYHFQKHLIFLIVMRTFSAIHRQDQILGIASADKGEALDVVRQRESKLCLKVVAFYCLSLLYF